MRTLGKLSLILVAACALAACSANRPLVGAGDPHGTLVTSSPVHSQPSMYYFFAENIGTRRTLVSQNLNPGEYIYPVSLVAINGKNVTSQQLSYYLRPGEHKIQLSMVVTVDAGLQTSIVHGQDRRGHMDIEVEAGKRYYLGAKYNPKESRRTRDWVPVIYRIEDKS